jgi:hypothetical protein
MGLKRMKPVGPDLQGERKQSGANKNEGLLGDETFLRCCKEAGIEPTRRQASKWRQGRGKARSVQ